MSHSDEVLQLLRRDGWSADRDVSPLVEQWKEKLRPFHDLSTHSCKILREFGGLTIGRPRTRGLECKTADIQFDPMLADGEWERLTAWGQEVGDRLSPIGVVFGSHGFLLVGETHRWYMMEDHLWLAGSDTEGALHTLLRGVRMKALHPDNEWRLGRP